jgi:hypothetical protein
MGLVGVHQAAPGSADWVWLCACGASGDGADREKAREQYRTHRSTCGQIPQLEVQVPTATKKTAAKKTTAIKKTAAKKTTTKAAEKSKRAVLLASDDPRLTEVVKRMKAGSGLIEEARRLGFTHNGPLRAALPKFVGGKKQYQELMAASRKNTAPVEKKKSTPKKKAPAKANPAPAEPPAAPSTTAEAAS